MHGPNDNRAGAQGALTMDELPWRSVPGGSIGMVTPATLAGHIAHREQNSPFWLTRASPAAIHFARRRYMIAGLIAEAVKR
jgi:hypothetical protein